MTKRTLQKEKTKESLVRTAFRVFAERGIVPTRTVDVAQEAGVSHGTVFAHFPTRDDLVVEVLREFGKAATQRTHDLASGGAGVRAVLQAHLETLMRYESFYVRLISEAALLPKEARQTLLGIQSALSFHLYQAAEEEMASGAIRPLPMHLLFNTWLGLVHYYLCNRDLFAPGESVLERYGQELLDHYMSLLKSTKGGKP